MAKTDASVLITGESGTGKGLVVKAIYYPSRRSGGPFVAVDCAAIPRELLESEVFGRIAEEERAVKEVMPRSGSSFRLCCGSGGRGRRGLGFHAAVGRPLRELLRQGQTPVEFCTCI